MTQSDNHLLNLNYVRGAEGQFERYAELARMFTRVSDELEQDNSPSGTAEREETDAALRLALVAMSEAEARINRQEKRIKYLESLSVTDELTQLLNRRGFNRELAKEFAQSKRDGSTGALIIVDLDGFKAVNDLHGHAAGDIMLSKVAQSLSELVRETDSIARVGGDEFAIILPATSASRARQKCADLERHLNAQSISWAGSILAVKASFGIQSFGPTDNLQDILKSADKNMYQKKAARKKTAA